jgi:DNA ligase D-like protein (predicted ligase)
MPASEPPSGSEWIHEIKHDGFRTMVAIDGHKARAFTRNGYDWTDRYGPVIKACASLACRSALIDGELVVEDTNGVSDFDSLASAIRYEPHRLVFYAFDLLHLDGEDLRGRELVERRAILSAIINPAFAIRYSGHFEGDGPAFFAAAVKHGLEGIVSKRTTSRYRSGPSKAWMKTKNVTESEFVLLGLERDTEGRPFAHVGREEVVGFKYAGMAFMTFGEKILAELSRKAETLFLPACAVKGVKRPRATWLRPEIRVQVRHLRNGAGLRHASVRAIV